MEWQTPAPARSAKMIGRKLYIDPSSVEIYVIHDTDRL